MPKGSSMKIAMLNFLGRNQSVAQPTQLFLALYSTNPTDADTGTEASYSGYARQPVTFNTPQINGGVASMVNSAAIQFGIVPAASGTIGFVGLKTAATGGDLVYYGPLAATYQLNQGVQPLVPIGTFTVTES